MEDQEIIREFLIESNENLGRLDQEMIELEKNPEDAALLGSIFRTIHTIKGTCGFLGFTNLESVTHAAENLLSKLRTGEKKLTPHITTLILESVDAARKYMASIEATGLEGTETNDDLTARLHQACQSQPATEQVAAASPAVAAPALSVHTSPEPLRPQPKESEAPKEEAEAPAPAQDAARSAAKTGSIADSTIRVDVGLLDKLMTLVGELVLTRNQILQVASQDDPTPQRLNLITSELQENVMRTRMQPIGVVWGKLPRVVRDLAASCGKQIDLDMEGADTEIDKTIIEAIKDPLTHIIRNSCDHGLEQPEVRLQAGKPATGRLFLRAFHEGGHVNIEISDDGAGIDGERVKRKAVQKGLLRSDQAAAMSERDAVNLVFLPGFSTAEKVTNISGRGVGMDVVKTNIEKIGGTIELTSIAGSGTTVKIKIPLTLAIIPGLIIHSGGERFVIPQVSLLELVRLEGEARKKSLENVYGTTVYRRRGNLLPVADLNEMLRRTSQSAEPDVTNIIILQAENRQFGLIVDGISDTQEIVVKPLGKQLKGTICYAGATIMGDGKVALILDVVGIAQMCKVLDRSRSRQVPQDHSNDRDSASEDKQAFLLFRAGEFDRLALPLALVARLEEIPMSRVERAAGKLVVQYRGEILPLISLDASMGLGGGESESLHVIVVSTGSRSAGLIVHEIIDIAEDRLENVTRSCRSGLLGSAVIGEQITDLLDLRSTLEADDPAWFDPQAPKRGSTILIADPSPVARGMLRTALEVAGYRVVEANSPEEITTWLRRTRIDAALFGLDQGAQDLERMFATVSRDDGTSQLPVIGLSTAPHDLESMGHHPQVRAYHTRYDRDAVLHSLQMLVAAVDEVAVQGVRS